MIPIAVSSTCFETNDLKEILALAEEHGLDCIELSGNIEFMELSAVTALLQEAASRTQLFVHNYFPPPDEPFVLNLGHPETVERSVRHCKQALDLCSLLHLDCFSIHAGFAFAPSWRDLGGSQGGYADIGLDESRRIFLGGLQRIAAYAAQRGIEFMVENNVVTMYNNPDTKRPRYHLCSPGESRFLASGLDAADCRILLDAAHLKVSARTFDFRPEEFMEQHRGRIRAAHLSENDGTADQNLLVREDSWFWEVYPWENLRYVSLEIGRRSPSVLADQVRLVQERLKNCFSSGRGG